MKERGRGTDSGLDTEWDGEKAGRGREGKLAEVVWGEREPRLEQGSAESGECRI